MDALTLLRGVRTEVEPPTTQALSRGRAALFTKIGDDAVPGSRPVVKAPRRRWIATTGVAAAAVAVALVVTNLTGVGGSGQSAVADVLHQSAVATIKTADPIVPPGKFLLVTTSAVNSQDHGGGSYLAIATDKLYVPADRSQDWVWIREPNSTFKTFGPASEAAAMRAKTSATEIVRAPSGGFYSRPSDSSAAASAKLPRDPRALLAYIHAQTLGQGNSVDAVAFGYIATALSDGLAPADLRAALYETAALIAGVTIEDRHTTLNGTTGIAIGYTDNNANIREEIIVDPHNGALIGQRDVLTKAESGIPAGTAITWTAKKTTIVNAAPAGGTLNGVYDTMGCTVTGPDSFQC